MKIYKYIGLSFLTLALAGCQNEEVVGGQQQEGVFTLKANMNGRSNESRAQIQLDNTWEDGEVFYWNAGDKFTLVEKESDSNLKFHEFTISNSYNDNSLSGTADFTTTSDLSKNLPFEAYYPTLREDDMGYNFYFNDTLPDNSDASRIAYFKNNMFMKVTGNAVSENMSLNFEQMCSLIRITYTNATDTVRTINKIEVDGSWVQGFHMSKNLESMGCTPQDRHGLVFTNGATVEAGQSENFYILYHPYNDKDNEPLKKVYINDWDLVTDEYPYGNNIPKFHEEPGMRFWFNVTETADGLIWNKDLGNVIIRNPQLSAALRNELGDEMVSINSDGYAVMKKSDVDSVTVLEFDNYANDNYTINSLNGIENFKNLEVLICNNNKLTDVTLTNSKLRKVELNDNQLESLDVSGLSNLQILSCAGNGNLQDNLNIEGTSLTEIRFQYTNATQLPGGLNPEILQILDCGDNQLTSLDLSEFKALKHVYFARNQLTSVVIPQDNAIIDLDFSDNSGITSLDLSNCFSLERLWIRSCNIQELNFSGCTNICEIYCHDNKLSSLDLTNKLNVSGLSCGNQRDDNGNVQNLALTLPKSLLERWNDEWKKNNDNYNVSVNGNAPEYCKVSNFYEFKRALSEKVGLMQVVLTANIEIESPLTPASSAIIWLEGYTLSIADNYESGNEKAVFNLKNNVQLNFAGGQLQGRDGRKLHDYYFNVAERFTEVTLNDVTLNTGSAIPSAFYMYHSAIHLENETNVTVPNYVVYLESPVEFEGYAHSQIKTNGTITGHFYIDNLNCRFEISSGTLKGNLIYSSLLNTEDIKEHVLLSEQVIIGENFTGWNIAGNLQAELE